MGHSQQPANTLFHFLDWLLAGCWLWPTVKLICILSTASREFEVIWGCTIHVYLHVFPAAPDRSIESNATPTQPVINHESEYVVYLHALSRRAVLTPVWWTSFSGWPRFKVLAFWAAIKCWHWLKRKSLKAMMDSGQDPREGLFPSLGLIVSCLLAVAHSQTYMYIIHWQVGSLTLYGAAPLPVGWDICCVTVGA